MKKIFTLCFLLVLGCSASSIAAPFGKFIGSYNVPSGTFLTLKKLLDTLNYYGVQGPVTIELLKDETAPSGGYILGSDSLNLSLSPTSDLKINGNGHLLTAAAGTGATDGIFKIQGADFVTINGMNLTESSANTTATTMMEWGYAVVRRKLNDGVQNLTIQACKVTLNRANTTAASGASGYGSTGIFVGNCLANSTTLLGVSAVDSGSHNGIFLFQDTIANVNSGIYVNGTQVAIDGAAFNDYGLTIQGNQIHNFSHNGIRMSFFNNDLVKGNFIDNMADGGTAPTTNSIYGIAYFGATTATNNSWRTDGNHIKLKVDGTTPAAPVTEAFGVYTGIFGTGTTEIAGDTIELASADTTNGLRGIFSENNQGTQTIRDNVIWNFSTSGITTNVNIQGIRNGRNTSPYYYPTKSLIKGNKIQDFNVATTASVLGIVDQSSTTSNPDIQNNVINNITITANAAFFNGITTGLQGTSVANTSSITNNSISGVKATGTSTVGVGIRPTASSLVTTVVTGNWIRNMEFGTGNLIGVDLAFALKATVTNDSIDNLRSGGNVYGLRAGYESNSAVATMELSKNQISNLNTSIAAGSSQAIAIAPGTGTTVTTSAVLNKNKIFNIYASGEGDTTAAISVTGGAGNYTITNNMIGESAAIADTLAFCSTYGIALQSSGNNKVYYNTINLKAGTAPASGYGATGILFNAGGTNTIQNNIVRVNVKSGLTNNTTAIRSTVGAASSAPSVSGFTASNNIYFTPTGRNNYLYVEGTTNASLVNGYHVSGLTANATKNIVNDTFFNSDCNKSSYHKFMNAATPTREKGTYLEDNLVASIGSYMPSGVSYAEAGAISVPTVTDDMTGAARPVGTSDIGAMEFAGTTLPKLDILVTSSTGKDTGCIYKLPSLTASVPPYFNRVSYQWYKDTSRIAGATKAKFDVDIAGGNYVVRVFDSATGCEYIDEGFKVTIMPPPVAMITYYDSLLFCETGAVVLFGNSGPGYTYQWFKNGLALPVTDDHYVASTTGSYTVEVNTPLGCPSLSEPIKVTVYPLPKPTIFWAGPRVLSTQKYYTYQWYKNNIKIDSFSKGQSYFALDDGAYTVEVTDSNGCTSKSTIYLFTVGIEDQQLAEAVKIFPNPTSGKVFIQSPVSVYTEITDITGRVIAGRAERKEADLSNYAEGVYMLSVTDKDGNLVKKEKIIRTK